MKCCIWTLCSFEKEATCIFFFLSKKDQKVLLATFSHYISSLRGSHRKNMLYHCGTKRTSSFTFPTFRHHSSPTQQYHIINSQIWLTLVKDELVCEWNIAQKKKSENPLFPAVTFIAFWLLPHDNHRFLVLRTFGLFQQHLSPHRWRWIWGHLIWRSSTADSSEGLLPPPMWIWNKQTNTTGQLQVAILSCLLTVYWNLEEKKKSLSPAWFSNCT